MEFLNQIFGQILGVINGVIGNYGISIIAFTIITRLLMLPLSWRQIKSTKEMQKIQPLVQEIQTKYAKDKEKQQVKMMELYKEHKINPLAGCLPLLIQMPLFFALFAVLREPMTYVPGMTEAMVNTQFLWMPNLAQPDLISNVWATAPETIAKFPGVLPILSSALTYYQFNFMNQQPTAAANGQGGNPMKFMGIIFPLMFLFWGTSMAGGLVLYWVTGIIFQMGQQFILNSLIDREA